MHRYWFLPSLSSTFANLLSQSSFHPFFFLAFTDVMYMSLWWSLKTTEGHRVPSRQTSFLVFVFERKWLVLLLLLCRALSVEFVVDGSIYDHLWPVHHPSHGGKVVRVSWSLIFGRSATRSIIKMHSISSQSIHRTSIK